MNKYTYADLPFEYLSEYYSLWINEDNNDYYIYIFKTKKELLENINNFYITTCVGMDLNLSSEIKNNIRLENEYMILHDFINKTKKIIKRDKIPEWKIFDEIIVKKKIKQTQFEFNVQDILHQIEIMYKLYSNDFNSLKQLLKNLKIKINYCKYNDTIQEEFIKVTTDNIYMFFDIQIINNNSGCNLFKCLSTKTNIQIIYLLAQPYNDNANKLCKRLMNTRMIGKVFHLKELIT
jgi:hypothetical protein